jgi:2-phosphoglycerate kinase
MIYLIGGPPRCGKTTVAKKLSKSWISADTIESIIASHTNKKDLNRLFPKSVIRKKTKQSNDIMYNSYSAKEIVKLYIKQSKASWKGIETMVACELNEGHNYIIEGHQIHPKLMDSIVKKYGKKNIVSLVLTRFDKDEIVSGCKKHKAKNDWFIQKTKNEDTFYKMAEMIKIYSEFFEKEARKYGIKVINMDDNFSKQLKAVITHLEGA